MGGAAKARAGVSFDQTMLFGTGGVALTKFDKGDKVSSTDGWKLGYLFGAGIEQGLAGGLPAKVEPFPPGRASA